MDFQGFVNTFSLACAVLSVQKASEGHCGEIRIVKANDVYRETMGIARYRDGMLYYELVPKDSKFEDFCYRAAILKKKMHTYVHSRGVNGWADITFLPLNCEDPNLSYCAFFFELTRTPDAEKMSDITLDTARSIIKAGVTMRGCQDFISGISAVISNIQEESDADVCSIITLDPKNRRYQVLCEKIKSSRKILVDLQTILPYSLVETLEKTVGKSNGVIIKDEIDMKEVERVNKPWVDSLRETSVNTIMLFPLFKGEKTIGYFFILNYNTEKLVEIKELMELTSQFIAAEIINHGLITELETASMEDLLTGVKNRTAMNLMVDRFVRGEETIESPYGVIFADVNGLEQVNEENGHYYGDKILKKAAEIIKEIFTGDKIYRSSGDEFVIIVPACREEDFKCKIEELKERTPYGAEVCLSIGSHWNEDGQKLRRSMHIADEEMYNEKAKFYLEHQNLERRRRS